MRCETTWIDGHKCPRCGSTLITPKTGDDQARVWCSFVGGGHEKSCRFGIDRLVTRGELRAAPRDERHPEPKAMRHQWTDHKSEHQYCTVCGVSDERRKDREGLCPGLAKIIPSQGEIMATDYTADMARRTTAEAKSVDNEAARMWLGCWTSAIHQAAKAGRNSVRETDVVRPKIPVPQVAKTAAETRLKELGYTVKAIAVGYNESTVEVLW